MNLKPLHFFRLPAVLCVLLLQGLSAKSQVTTTITATGTTGSYITGSVNSAGTKNDGLISNLNTGGSRGWAIFDLSSIPVGSTVTAATVKFTTTSASVNSTAVNTVSGFTWTSTNDPATASGPSLYTALNGTAYNSSSWTVNALQTKVLNAAGVTMISNSVGSKVVLSFVRGSTNNYEIFGYNAANSANIPQLEVTYTPSPDCSGTPTGGTATASASGVCPGQPFTLSLTGATVTAGITYQWESSPVGANTWTPIPGATFSSYGTTMTGDMDYHAVVTCTIGGASDVSSTVTVTQNSFVSCYCTPASTCTNEGILNVTFNALNNASAYCASTSGYSDYTSLGALAIATQSEVVSMSVTGRVNSNPASAGVWIDYDHSGSFDASEYTSLGSSTGLTLPTPYTYTANVTIPATALTGTTRMRVRQANQGGITAASACTNSGVFGEYEDYLIDITAGTGCSGTPTAGTINAPATVCPNVDFTLTVAGFTSGVTGISYFWESTPAGTGAWAAIPNATNATYTATGGITADMEYRFNISCANGGGTDVSPSVTIGVSPFTQCYCTPATTSSTYFINNFSTTNGISNVSNLNSGYSPGGYGNFSSSQVVSVLENGGINFTGNYGALGTYTFGAKIWVDWNQNGSFADAGEQMFATTAYANSFSGSFSVPVGALPGVTRMRVGANYNSSTGPANACAGFANGEYEDYAFEVVPLIACSGMPSTGTASGPAAVCPSTTFTLTTSGVTVGTGLTYQWESSPLGAGSWTPIANATNTSYSVTGGITSDMDYQLVVTCTNTGDVAVSNTVSVTISSFLSCYCTPASGCTNEGIENVTMGSLNNSSTFCASTSGYSDYSSLGSLTTVTQAGIVPISVTARINSSPASVGVWIDYDHNGIFDASEYTAVGTLTGITPLPSSQVYTANINIPATAMTGTTRMRVRQANQGGITATSACTNTGVYGEYEDYLIDIVAGSPCAGTPVAGTVTAPANICPSVAFTLSTTGTTSGVTDLSYQWESAPAGSGSWTPIVNATNLTYTETAGITAATDYRMNITCANGGGTDVTPDVTVLVNAPTQCYCTPSGSSATYGINNFSTTGGSTNISNLSSGTSPGGYGNYTTQTLTVAPGDAINFTANYLGSGYTYGFAIFIDYNQNGSFADAGETVFNTTGYATSASGSFTIPVTAPPGNTRIRTVANYFSSNPSGQYCTTGISGEFEDYTLSVGAPPSCLAPTGLNASGQTTTSADINWTFSTSNPSVGYEYIHSTTNTPPATGVSGTPVGPTVNSVNLQGLASGVTHYFWVRSDCGGGNYSSWAQGSFQTLIANDLPSGATPLTLGAGCTGNPYNNTTATHVSGEPALSCHLTNPGTHSLWYQFVAPASGAVKVSTDVAPAGTLTDSKIGILSATDVNDFNTFTLIACDEDNGFNVGNNSVVYAVDLVPGQTYYIEVDGYGTTTVGTFCLTVDEMTASMIAAAGSCAGANTPYGGNAAYTGWTSIVTNDANTQLVALVRNTTGVAQNSFTTSVTVNTGAVRSTPQGQLYMDRNFRMNNAVTTATDVLFFFRDNELTALSTASSTTGGPAVTLADLVVTKQTGTACAANFDGANGTETLLTPTTTGTLTGGGWVGIQTNSFSNFYLHIGAFPLTIALGDISATNMGSRNRIDWNTLSEEVGDRFELERSTDGSNFTRIASIPAKGLASAYSYWDEAPATGVNYYRLKLTDVSGEFAYSDVVSATVMSGSDFFVEAFPNPVGEVLTVRANGITDGNITVSITDVTGKTISVHEMKDGVSQINMSRLSPGVYLIKYADNSHKQTIRVNKL